MARRYFLSNGSSYFSGFDGRFLPIVTPYASSGARFDSRTQLDEFLKRLDPATCAELDKLRLVPMELEVPE